MYKQTPMQGLSIRPVPFHMFLTQDMIYVLLWYLLHPIPFAVSNAVRPMPPLILARIEVFSKGETFAHTVMLELLPHFSLGVLLSAELAALRTVNNLVASDILPLHCCLPILVHEIVSCLGDHRTCMVIYIFWTFLSSRNSCLAAYLSTMSWEECAHFFVRVFLIVPRKAFARLYFCAFLLTFLPGVRQVPGQTVWCVRKPSVHVDYALLLTVVFVNCLSLGKTVVVLAPEVLCKLRDRAIRPTVWHLEVPAVRCAWPIAHQTFSFAGSRRTSFARIADSSVLFVEVVVHAQIMAQLMSICPPSCPLSATFARFWVLVDVCRVGEVADSIDISYPSRIACTEVGD